MLGFLPKGRLIGKQKVQHGENLPATTERDLATGSTTCEHCWTERLTIFCLVLIKFLWLTPGSPSEIERTKILL